MVSQRLPVLMVLATILCLVPADGKNRTKCVSTNATCWPTPASFAALNGHLLGYVVLPGDKAWASAIKIKNPRLHIVPGAVVMANNASDVVLAIKYAAAHELEISIKSTGKGFLLTIPLNSLAYGLRGCASGESSLHRMSRARPARTSLCAVREAGKRGS